MPLTLSFPRVTASGRVVKASRVTKSGRAVGSGRIPHRFGYLLQDTFSSNLVAGSVNGTLADTGQARIVVDSTNHLSTSGGQVLFTGGGVGGDPTVRYPTITRQSGALMVARIVAPTTTINANVGFDGDLTGSAKNSIRFLSTAVLQLIVDGSGVTVSFPYSAGTYDIAVVIRNNGHFFFVKGGIFTYWSLIWASTVGSDSLIYPTIGYTGASSADFSASNIRVPDFLWLPVPLISDSFVRANGVLGTTDGLATAEQNGGSGFLWNGSTWTIVTNKAINTPTESADVIVNGGFGADANWTKETGWTISGGVAVAASSAASKIYESSGVNGTWYRNLFTLTNSNGGVILAIAGSVTGTQRTANGTYASSIRANGTVLGISKGTNATGSVDDVSFFPLTLSTLFASLRTLGTSDVQATVDATILVGMQAGIVLNLDSDVNPQNFVIAYHDGTNAKLEKCVAGTYTTVITAAVTYVAGAPIRVTKKGTTYILHYNNVAVGAVSTVSDSTIINNFVHGLFSTNSGNQLSNFIVRPVGSNNEYSQLDVF